MGKIKIKKLNSLARAANNLFVELQRVTFISVPKADKPCFSACLVSDQDEILKNFHEPQLLNLLEAVTHCRLEAAQALYIMKLNATHSNPIVLAPYELTEISACSFISTKMAHKRILVRHPFPPHEAVEYSWPENIRN